MAKARILGQGTTTVQSGRQITINSATAEVLDKYTGPKDTIDADTPSIGTLATFENYVGSVGRLKLLEKVIVEDGEWATATLKYVDPDLSTSPKELPPDVKNDTITRSSGSTIEIPIEQHPDYVASWAASKPGVESYILPGVTVNYTFYDDTFTFDESSMTLNVGKREVPTPLTSGDNTKWLKMNRDAQRIGDTVEIVDTWQYSPAGWDTDIYE